MSGTLPRFAVLRALSPSSTPSCSFHRHGLHLGKNILARQRVDASIVFSNLVGQASKQLHTKPGKEKVNLFKELDYNSDKEA